MNINPRASIQEHRQVMTTLSRGNPGKQNVQILSLQFLSPDPHKAKETGGQIQKDRPLVSLFQKGSGRTLTATHTAK